MESAAARFDAIVEHCRMALRNSFSGDLKFQAGQLFEAEVQLLRRRGFQEHLIQIVNLGQQLRQRNVKFHLIGAGASSLSAPFRISVTSSRSREALETNFRNSGLSMKSTGRLRLIERSFLRL